MNGFSILPKEGLNVLNTTSSHQTRLVMKRQLCGEKAAKATGWHVSGLFPLSFGDSLELLQIRLEILSNSKLNVIFQLIYQQQQYVCLCYCVVFPPTLMFLFMFAVFLCITVLKGFCGRINRHKRSCSIQAVNVTRVAFAAHLLSKWWSCFHPSSVVSRVFILFHCVDFCNY